MQPIPLDAPVASYALPPVTIMMRSDPRSQARATRGDCPDGLRVSGLRWGIFFAAAVLIGNAVVIGGILAAQTNSAQTATATHRKKPASSHANLTATQPAAQPAPAAPQAPPPPNWPANDRPSEAKVTWDSKGLSILATNSSLSQILKDISTQTGATLQGFNRDERIFGAYGPGPARDVINQLLDGSGYNVLMIGDQGEGTPRQIVLTPRSGGAAQPTGTNNPNPQAEEDNEVEQEAQQPEPPPPPPQPTANEPLPGVPMHTQQEILQQMQLRQQQLQQQQQQQQNNPQR